MYLKHYNESSIYNLPFPYKTTCEGVRQYHHGTLIASVTVALSAKEPAASAYRHVHQLSAPGGQL